MFIKFVHYTICVDVSICEGGGVVVIIMHRGRRSSGDGGEHRGYKNPRSF